MGYLEFPAGRFVDGTQYCFRYGSSGYSWAPLFTFKQVDNVVKFAVLYLALGVVLEFNVLSVTCRGCGSGRSTCLLSPPVVSRSVTYGTSNEAIPRAGSGNQFPTAKQQSPRSLRSMSRRNLWPTYHR